MLTYVSTRIVAGAKATHLEAILLLSIRDSNPPRVLDVLRGPTQGIYLLSLQMKDRVFLLV